MDTAVSPHSDVHRWSRELRHPPLQKVPELGHQGGGQGRAAAPEPPPHPPPVRSGPRVCGPNFFVQTRGSVHAGIYLEPEGNLAEVHKEKMG